MRLLLLSCLFCSIVHAENWTQFRGNSAGKVAKISHPTEWSAEKNVAWSASIKGSGWSSPIVLGERVFVTAAESEDGSKPKGMMAGVASMRTYRNAKPSKHRYVLSCLNLLDGKLLWSKQIDESVPPVVHPSNTYATESPATDGERIFCFFATTGVLSAWETDGREIWRRELGAYKSGNGFGTGSSLTTLDGTVFVQYDNDEQSFVAAFDGATGEPKWRDDRPTKTSWSTPLIWQKGAMKQLVACGSDVVTAYNPADGTVIWRLSGMQSGFSGSPAMDEQRIYFGNSGPMSQGPLVAVNFDTSGELQLDREFKADEIAWSRTRSGPGMASPVVAKGHIYIPGSGGILNCYNAATGERAYRNRVDKMKTVVASLWADEDQVFILDEDGTTHIIEAGPEYKRLATNKIDDLFWSTPTIAGDTLLLRGVEKIYCIRK